jgi:hypothetical protein
MPRVGFEPTALVFERVKKVQALDRAANVIGYLQNFAALITFQNVAVADLCASFKAEVDVSVNFQCACQ